MHSSLARIAWDQSAESLADSPIRVIPSLNVRLCAVDDAQAEAGRDGRVLVVVEATAPRHFADHAHAPLTARGTQLDPNFVVLWRREGAHVQAAFADVVRETV